MQSRLVALSVMCMAALWPCRIASGAVVTHTNVEDFLPGISDGVTVPIIERDKPATGLRNGGVMVVPQPGTPVLSDDFTYANQAAAESAGWFFQIIEDPGAVPVPPSSFSFTATPGSLRMSIGRPQDFFNPNIAGQSNPVLAVRKTPLDGDFIVETKMTFAEPRQRQRVQGIIIGTFGDDFNPLIVGPSLRYIAVGPDDVTGFGTTARTYSTGTGEFPWNIVSGNHAAQSMIVRVVKLGTIYYSFYRASETEPWTFMEWFKAPMELDGDPSRPLAVGLYAKSFGGKNAVDDIQNVDYDYFRVSRINPDLTGEYTGILDAGQSAFWNTLSVLTQSSEGYKLQMRTGNTLAGGTLTDAGSFVGPDGQPTSFFEEDVINVVPNPDGKRYLEYKLFLDQTIKNLPASVLSVSADYQPAAIKTVLASDSDDWGTGGTGIAVQPGGGDLSLTRTQTLLEEFNGPVGSEWSLREGDPAAIPLGSYNTTDRPGYLRLKVGFPQDIFVGGNDVGGVAALRTLPPGATNFEVETEINMEAQQNRQGGLHLWLNKDNFVGISVARRNYYEYTIGVVGDVVLGDGIGLAPTTFYGSNTMQLRLAKVGPVITAAYRDAASPSPGWHVLYTINTTKLASGAVDFAPTHVALLGKSYAEAVRDDVSIDYNYLKFSSLANTGTKDFTLALPAGSTPDSLLVYGEAVAAAAAKFQINSIGPDGTAASFFTANEPKIPASIAGQTSAQVRVLMDATQTTGVPYLHATGIQYVTGGTRVAHDTNRTDFAAGTVMNGVDAATVPGAITPTVSVGTPVTQDFASQPAGWLFSNLNPGPDPEASFSFAAGAARLTVPRPVDTWGQPPLEKPRAFLYEDKVYTGDYDLEAKLNVAEARQLNRHGGIAIVAARTAGTTPDDKIDMANLLMFGPWLDTEMRFMRFENNGVGDFGNPGWPGQQFFLRIRKLGNTFTGYAKVNEADPWTELTSTTHPNLNNAYIGFMAKSWPGANDIQNYDFDYLKVTPLSSTGNFESRVLDLGATGLFPLVSTLGGNSGGVQIQWRAADTTAALAAAPYVGPDGTSATTFAGTFQGFLPQSFMGKRYYQYKALLPAGTTLNDLSIIGLTTGPVSPLANAIAALRIAGGLDAATPAQVTSLDLVKGDSAGKVEILDAVAAARTALGL